MTEREAAEMLAQDELVPCIEASMELAKKLQNACLAADIPALLYRDEHCAKGCAPRVQILAREGDLQRIGQLLNQEWQESLMREGVLDEPPAWMITDEEPAEDPACPACGTAAPLIDGACSDCGLQLEFGSSRKHSEPE